MNNKLLILLAIVLLNACSKPKVDEMVSETSSLQFSRHSHFPPPPPPPPANQVFVTNPGNDNDIQPNLQIALNNATPGTVLVLPAGSFVYNQTLDITKDVSIMGAGMDKTFLYRSETISDSILQGSGWNSFFNITMNSTLSNKISISDLSIRSKKPSIIAGDGGSLAADFGIKIKECVDFVITRCRFENFGYAAVSVMHDDVIARGLINKNQFNHNSKGADGLGLGYAVLVYGTNTQWISNPQFGSSNFIFVEDNTFDFHRHSIAAGGCALYVFRHNAVNNNNIGALSGQAIDAHEARQVAGANYYSTRAVEIYNNTVINTTTKSGAAITSGVEANLLVENAIMIRGGEALIHDNTISGYRFGLGIINFEVGAVNTYPIFTQMGYLSGLALGSSHTGYNMPEADGDLFFWNNNVTTYPGTGAYSSSAFYNYQPTFFLEGRDYHLLAKPMYSGYTYPHPASI
jgi:hypothetical protein